MSGTMFTRHPDDVRVIRCKDCQYQIKNWVKDGRRRGGGYWQHSCQENEYMGEDSQFCSLGKRKE